MWGGTWLAEAEAEAGAGAGAEAEADSLADSPGPPSWRGEMSGVGHVHPGEPFGFPTPASPTPASPWPPPHLPPF